MTLKKLGFMNINRNSVLTRNEMKRILAGSSSTCCEFYEQTGCYPTFADPNSTCRGTDGRLYSAATSSGSCPGGCPD